MSDIQARDEAEGRLLNRVFIQRAAVSSAFAECERAADGSYPNVYQRCLDSLRFERQTLATRVRNWRAYCASAGLPALRIV